MDPGLLSAVSSGAFALLGAGVGAAGAALVQTRSARLERDKLSHDTRGRVNALSVAVFRELLASCKEVERTAERREAGGLIDEEEIYIATSRMWLRWQEVIVFCDPRIEKAVGLWTDVHRHEPSVGRPPQAILFRDDEVQSAGLLLSLSLPRTVALCSAVPVPGILAVSGDVVVSGLALGSVPGQLDQGRQGEAMPEETARTMRVLCGGHWS
jgi:hypothetical protein